MTYQAALIDLDGTLVNTVPDLADATNAMRTQMGLRPLPQDVIARYVGKGTENLVKKALSTQLNQKPDHACICSISTTIGSMVRNQPFTTV